jgi:DNA-binding IclR family transcriptional regulator
LAASTVRAVDRALSIIKLLAEERRPLGIGEIAEATGLAPATVHRFLASLAKEDWVEQNPVTSRYRLGFGLLGTAAAALAYTPLVSKARGTLQRVSDVTGLDSWLGVLVGRRVAYLAQGEGRQGRHGDFQAGVHHAAHATCGGKVLLAGLPLAERRRLYRGRRRLRSYTSRTITDLSALEGALEEVGTKGYAIDPGELRQSWYGVAVPVRGSEGRVIATIITGGREADLDQLAALVPELKFLSEELSIEISQEDE